MRLWSALVLALVLAVGVVVAANCTEQDDNMPSCEDCGREELPPACDPDDLAPCPDDWFVCTEDGAGGKLCEGQVPAVPDGGDWVCAVEGDQLVCRGDEMPGEVVCRRDGYTPADRGDGYTWECEYEGEFVVCHGTDDGDGGGDADADADADADSDVDDDGFDLCPPGIEVPTDDLCGDGIDNNCDGNVDETCPDEPPCVCIAGAWRYCDERDYCHWGTQECAADGMSWGPCIETRDIPAECVTEDYFYSPEAEACCISAGFCCQDFHDLDHDGTFRDSLGDCTDIICVPTP
jgi:hypothetical protein